MLFSLLATEKLNFHISLINYYTSFVKIWLAKDSKILYNRNNWPTKAIRLYQKEIHIQCPKITQNGEEITVKSDKTGHSYQVKRNGQHNGLNEMKWYKKSMKPFHYSPSTT